MCWHAILTISNVVVVDPDELVPVRTALLVPPPQSVEHLMHHNALVLAAASDGDVLPASHSAHVGIASVESHNILSSLLQ